MLKKSRNNVEWEIDYNFLLCQREVPQRGSMDRVVKILARKDKEKTEREARMEKRKQRELLRVESTTSTLSKDVAMFDNGEFGDDDETISDADTDSDTDLLVEFADDEEASEVCSRKSPVVNVELPAKSLLDATASTALRLGLPNRQHLSIVTSTINAGNASLENFTLSVGSVHRKKRNIEEVAAKVREPWTKPKFGILHWDSKLINRAGGIEEDRIAIIISPPPKLLGIPVIPRSTGVAQKDAVIEVLRKWDAEGCIIGSVFDTTASNTGQFSGAAAIIEKELGRLCRPLLWLPCRHHVAE